MRFQFYMFLLTIIASLFLIGSGVTGFVVSQRDTAFGNYFVTIIGLFVLVSSVVLLYLQVERKINPKY